MSNLLITGITLDHQWKIHMVDPLTWQAWIVDPSDTETGSPLLESFGFESLISNIKLVELGMRRSK